MLFRLLLLPVFGLGLLLVAPVNVLDMVGV